ncbi:MAG: hypothetical protein IPN69_19630 [Acidobacteria bacterium]|nr:hypothetical protein [Acidobacteriota bacterium]
MSNGPTELSDFLLGKTDEFQTERIDLMIISGEITADELAIAENALIEDCLEGVLSPPDISHFFQDFLNSPSRRQNFVETAALRRMAQEAFVGDNCEEARSESYIQVFGRFFSARPFVWASAALLLLSFAGIASWFLLGKSRPAEVAALEKRYAESNRGDLSDLSKFSPDAVKTVFPTSLRSADGNRKFILGTSDELLFRLSVPFETSASYTLTAVRDGVSFFELRDLKPSNGEIRVLLPRSIFRSGRVTFQLQDPGSTNSLITYEFSFE